MVTKSLVADPGTTPAYSNFGYWLLGRVVAKKRGFDQFYDAIKSHIMEPVQVTRLRVSWSLASAQAPDEARYHSPDLVLQQSVMSPDRPWVPREYGDENLEKMEPSGGLSMAATDFARILAALNVGAGNPLLSSAALGALLKAAATSFRGHGWDAMLPQADGYLGQKGGILQTSQNSIYYRTGGLAFVVCWNQVGVQGDWYPWFPEVVSAASSVAWGKADLFPEYGMPSF